MTKDELDKLKNLAERAIPGPLEVNEDGPFSSLKRNLSKDTLTRLEEEVSENESLRAQLAEAREVIEHYSTAKAGGLDEYDIGEEARAYLEKYK